jgi:hypothetical protein
MTESSLVSRRTDAVGVWAVLLAASDFLVFVGGVVVQTAVVNSTGEFVDLVGPAFVYSIVGATITCALVAVAVGRRPRSRELVIQSAAMGVLAGLAPISLVVFLRLSYHACAVMNVLALPWPEPWREIAHWGSAAIWLASTAFLIFAVATPRLRRAGVAMWIWSGVIAIPTVFISFLTVYGDPVRTAFPSSRSSQVPSSALFDDSELVHEQHFAGGLAVECPINDVDQPQPSRDDHQDEVPKPADPLHLDEHGLRVGDRLRGPAFPDVVGDDPGQDRGAFALGFR